LDSSSSFLPLSAAVCFAFLQDDLTIHDNLSRRFEDTLVDQLRPVPNAMRQIDRQDNNGGATDRRAAHQHRAVPAEVPVPLVTARIEEPTFLARLWVDASQVRTLVTVTRETGRGAILKIIPASVLFGDDVLDLEHKFVELLRHPAVFATVACPFQDFLSDGIVHGSGAGRGLLQHPPSF